MARPEPATSTAGYTLADVAKLLGLSVGQIRSYVRAGFVSPRRGSRGEARLTFQDVVLLRTAKSLLAARIPPRRLRLALGRLKERLPRGRSLAGLHIATSGGEVVVREGGAVWNPASGQSLFDFDSGFEVSELARKVAPLARRAVREGRSRPGHLRAEDWYELGCDLESNDGEEARDAYRRALELDPGHAETHINLGRLLHGAGELAAAESHYRVALAAQPDATTAAFNLGVALQDLARLDEAIEVYHRVLRADPGWADAHYNLAGLYERTGEVKSALRHLKEYKRLTHPLR